MAELTIWDLCAAAESAPGAVALRTGAGALSYADLYARSAALAAELQAHGAGPGRVVALQSADPAGLLIALLAAARAGAVWTVLPVWRSGDAAAALLARAGAALLVRDGQIEPTGASGGPLAGRPGCSGLAALSFRSSASGRQEGLLLSHAGLVGAARFVAERLKPDLSATLVADGWADSAGLPVVLAALLRGGRLIFAAPDGLGAQARAQAARTLVLPLAALAAADPADLGLDQLANIISFGEDTVSLEALKQAARASQIVWHNFYGFPEIQMVSTVRPAGDGGFVHVGRPAAGTQAFVLDPARCLAPVGMPGALALAGAGVCAGLLDHPALEQRTLRDSRFQPGLRLWHTGVTARWLDQGQLELLGRGDSVVSRGGCRMALAELEALLQEHPDVAEAAVVQRTAADGSVGVTAFVVSALPLDQLDLRGHLERACGPGMFPVGFVQSDPLPRLPDGAPDRAALAAATALDTLQLAELERGLRAALGSDEIALLRDDRPGRPEPLHLSDLLPPRAARRSAGPAAPQSAAATGAGQTPAHASGGPLPDDPAAPHTLADALRQAARREPGHGVRCLLSDGGGSFLTYPELLGAAERALAGLRAAGLRPGDHALFVFDRNRDFLVAFWACMLGGFVAVPLSVPPHFDPSNAAAAKLFNAWSSLARPALLAGAALQQPLRRLFAAQGGEPAILNIEELDRRPPDRRHHPGDPEDPALLLLTSGSTGAPKGVVLSHRNVVARSRGAGLLNRFSSADISFNWMPLDHVGGIVMFHIHDLCHAMQQIHAPTDFILEQPVRWLDLIERYRVSSTWAPNFAYALINERHEQVSQTRRDLTCLRFILNGGEAVQARTAQTFLRLLQPHGLRPDAMHPAYGMSETSSGITFSQVFALGSGSGIHELDQSSLRGPVRAAEEGAASVTFVEVGVPIPGVEVRIVDPQQQVLPEGLIGRLQARGEPVTRGYYANPELNRATFTEDGWFTTGDLGFLLDGRLTITGREKDVIIINGVNYHSHEIEALVEGLDGIVVSCTAACALRRPESATEELVIFFCPTSDVFERQLEQVAEVRRAVGQKYGLTPSYVIPVTPADIPKTAIGKIQRTLLSQQFAEGAFDHLSRKIDRALGNERTLPDWFFHKVWRPLAPPQPLPRSGRVALLLGGDGPLESALAQRLAEQGARVVRALPGAAFTRPAADRLTLAIDQPEHYRLLLEALRDGGLLPDDLIHTLAYPPAPADSLAELRGAQHRGVLSVLYLVQALAQIRPAPAALTVATGRAQAVLPDEPLNYAHAPVGGLLKTIPLELGWLACRHVDLEARDPAADAALLLAELSAPRGQAETAHRGGRRLAPRLARAALEQTPARDPFAPGGLYLITGGLGGIGAQVARWLAASYQAHLLLLGSTPLEERPGSGPRQARRRQTYAELQAEGIDLRYEALDLSDPAQIAAAVGRAEAHWGQPLAGVLHLAGAGNLAEHWAEMDRHKVTVETGAVFEWMFAPKLYGSWAIQQALRDRPELLVVLTSSVNSFFGGATFCAYTAANSFVDTFAAHLRATTHPRTVCLNWTQWDNLGMSAGNPPALREAARSRGYQLIGADQGLQSLLAAAARDRALTFVGLDPTCGPVRALLDSPPAPAPGLRLYIGAHAGPLGLEPVRAAVHERYGDQPLEIYQVERLPRAADGRVDLAELGQLGGALRRRQEPAEPTNEIERRLAEIWKEVLGRSAIGIYDNFFALGGHSLLATQILSRLRELFHVELRLHQIFEQPTVAGLAETIAQLQLAQVGEGDLEERPPEKPAHFLRRVQEKAGGDRRRIEPRADPASYPVSWAQRRLWLLEQLQLNPALHNIVMPVAIQSGQAPDRLRAELVEGLSLIVSRHETLRANFHAQDGEPVQRIAPPRLVDLAYVDLSGRPAGQREDEARRTVTAEAWRPFDLARDLLLRGLLLRLEPDRYTLVLTAHHIAFDAWSVGVLIAELGATVPALSGGRPAALAPLPIQYADYAAWQQGWLQGELLEQQLAYWRGRLGAQPPLLALPISGARPAQPSYHSQRRPFTIPAPAAAGLRALAQREGATLFMVLLAVWFALLHRYSGQDDIVVGSPIANRTRRETEGLIGFFVNTLPLRVSLAGRPTFRELLGRVRETALGAYAHQDLPFERMVEAVRPERALHVSPLFQTMCMLQNTAQRAGDGSNVLLLTDLAGPELFDLVLSLAEDGPLLRGVLAYQTDLFEADSIDRMADQLLVLAEAAAASPDTPLARLPLLRAAQRQTILADWNATAAPFPADQTLHDLFEQQAARAPSACAVVCGGTELSYAELNRRANRLAHHLRRRGVAPETPVGLCLQRGPEMAVAVLAVLKAGGAFVPIDPGYPAERLSLILEEARPALVLTSGPPARLPPGWTALDLGAADSQIAAEPEHNPAGGAGPDSLAYLIFTSGSTGRPKGAMIEHRSVCCFALDYARRLGVGGGSRVLQFFSFGFDGALAEIFTALLSGAALCFGESPAALAGAELLGTLRRYAVSTAILPPAVLALISPGDLPDLHTLGAAGEPCSGDIAARWGQGRRFFNIYGPTEATIGSTMFQADPARWGEAASLPIGFPMDNTTVYLLDAGLEPVPVGLPGEIYLGGAGVGRGYLGQPGLTAEKFVPDPFGAQPGARLYRTGDIGRHRSDGALEFLDRADDQVKIRGFRVELGEIELALRQHPLVREAAVVAPGDGQGSRRLVAYVVPAQDGGAAEPPDLAGPALRAFLQPRLPAHCIPSVFVVLPALPVSSSGKVDRRALAGRPVAAVSAAPRPCYAPPQSDLERQIAPVWQEVLQIGEIGIDDNFFDLGGTSLNLVKVQSRLQTLLGQEPPMLTLFQHPTIRALAAHLRADPPAAAAARGAAEAAERTQRQREMLQRQRRRAQR